MSGIKQKWLAVDIDGTLAEYLGWTGEHTIGSVIPAIADRVKQRYAEGWKIAIFTANLDCDQDEAAVVVSNIWEWLSQNSLAQYISEITCIKKKCFTEFWDDRAKAVEKNHGVFTEELLCNKLEIERAEVKRLQGLLYAKNTQDAQPTEKACSLDVPSGNAEEPIDKFTELFKRMRYDMFNSQEGGNHYSQFLIQPGIYNYVNKLPSYEANVVKYISRHEFKNGLQDVKKAIECAKQLAAIRYGVEL